MLAAARDAVLEDGGARDSMVGVAPATPVRTGTGAMAAPAAVEGSEDGAAHDPSAERVEVCVPCDEDCAEATATLVAADGGMSTADAADRGNVTASAMVDEASASPVHSGYIGDGDTYLHDDR